VTPSTPQARDPYAWIERALATLHRANWYRSVTPIRSRPGAVIERNGRSLVNLGSNDYLGLAGDPRPIEAAVQAARELGTGSTGSRLLSGHRALHRELETALATLKGTDDALVFSSGYLANLGTIAALVGPRDLVLGDRYNHASLKTGAAASGACTREYAHCDLGDLQAQLARERPHYRRCLIATDSAFSMDGDLCPLPQLLDLAESAGCMVLVDEAHATGVLGATGAGCVESWGCGHRPMVQVGTLSKALGSLGGYVAGSAALIDYLRNRTPSWIYTTGLSPADAAAAREALRLVREEPQRREWLWANADALKQQLSGHALLPSQTPIVCLQAASPVRALTLAQQLEAAGVFAPAVRPPTVPTSRIRFSVMATHQREHLQRAAAALEAEASS